MSRPGIPSLAGLDTAAAEALRAMVLKIYADATWDEAEAWAETVEAERERYATEVFV